MENEELIFDEKNMKKYDCKLCHYKCSYLSDWNRHITTVKHKNGQNGIKMENEEMILGEKNNQNNLTCEKCDKEYKTQSGLWKHNKKCNLSANPLNKIINNIPSDITVVTSIHDLMPDKSDWFGLIQFLIKENSEIKNMVIEMSKNNTGNVTSLSNNNVTTNSHNKTFNLQFFLNETCKDAMNISEFIETIKIDVSDLENMGRVGYVEGMSSIFVKNLNCLDITKRPIHCTDKKREIMYIKDNNIWEKDDEQRNKLHRTIKRVSHKNIKILPAYREKYPGCEFAISRFSDNYNKMIVEVMGGPGDNDAEKEDKIIQKITKYIIINKGIPIEE